MAAFPTQEGYLTLATGHGRYVEFAANLALSVKHKDRRPIALLHDERVEVPQTLRPFFDAIIEAKSSRLLPGLDAKLQLQNYSPFERTMYLDADCLMAKGDAGCFWDRLRDVPFSVVGDAIRRGPYCKFPDVAELIARMGLPHMIRHNGGFMYFDQSEAARNVFRRARAYYEEHRDYLSYRHSDPARGHNEEPLFAAAMALLGLKPVPPRENLMYTARKGPYDIDVLRGHCAYGEDPVVSPTFVHFVRLEPRDVYVRETNRLRRWFGVPPWFPPGTDEHAVAIEPFARVPAKADILPLLPQGGVAAEIGVFKGCFSQTILDLNRPATLHLVDPWAGEVSSGGVTGQGDELYQLVLGRFQRKIEAGQVAVHRKTSAQAAQEFPDGHFDWVFLDANHGFAGMMQDLEAWFPKVKPGGYITGHDYTDVKGYGVIQAVDEFRQRAPVHLVALSGDEYASFVLRKRLAGEPQPVLRCSILSGTPLCH
ncbi:MAG TPA: class I SAM-dependent methyltransferase [Planctomycetota bacterium]|nr:class I SAM-dependent methyltransferase [Planctomycetota bacterium]HRR81964.1 class I SAM-dependent methyltransferase [Planctomycetota bacterium]HRT96679.1 class I SAM-dependent methyltransferase [Planctomycetota bacterium]